jgi:anti-anti-sigma factor
MRSPPRFAINESRTGGWLRLSGELDLESARMLDERLNRLRARRSPVRLDLSNLDFTDSTGIHLLVRMLGEPRVKHWELEIEHDLSPQVMRVFKLAHLDKYILSPI